MTADQPPPDVETVLAGHADCLTNCDVNTLGVWEGEMHYEVVFTCGIALPLPCDTYPRDHNPAHLAAVLEPPIREREAKAWRDSRLDLAAELRESGAWSEVRMAEWVELRADRTLAAQDGHADA